MKQTSMQITEVCAELRSDAPQNVPLYRSPNLNQGQEVGADKGKESVRVYVPTAKSETNNSNRFFLQRLETWKQITDGNDKTCEESRMHEAELKYLNTQK